MNEKEYYESIKGKFIRVFTTINGYQFKYSGILDEVFDDKILINDIKTGKLSLAFEGLSVVDEFNPAHNERVRRA